MPALILTGTAYAGIRADWGIYRRGAKALAEGLSIRATGRLVEVDKDTVNHWLPVLGDHGQGVMSYFFRDLHRVECQLDDVDVHLQERSSPDAAGEVGRSVRRCLGVGYNGFAFSPVCKWVPAWVVGKHTLPHARRLVFGLKSAADGQIPFFIRTCPDDELPHYAEAFLEVYGKWRQPPRHGTRGRFPNPRRIPPPDLCYAVVVKERENSRVVEVTTRIVYGTTEQVEAAYPLYPSPVSRTINPYGVERNRLRRDGASTSGHVLTADGPQEPALSAVEGSMPSRKTRTAWSIN